MRTLRLPAEDDAKTESARQRHETKSETKTRLHLTIRYQVGGDFTVHNIKLHDFIVHHNSLNQLKSYISLSLSWSLASAPTRLAGTSIYTAYHIQNSTTLVQNVTTNIYNNYIHTRDISVDSLYSGKLHSVAESSLDRQSATTFFRPSLYLNVTLYDCRDNNHLINFALFVLDSVIYVSGL